MHFLCYSSTISYSILYSTHFQQGIKVTFIAAGAAACHSVVGDINGRCFVWGRNEKGQLGLGDHLNRNVPVLLNGLKDVKVVGGACGRYHTAVITDSGDAYSFGLNSMGQCGTGSVKKTKGVDDMHLVPVKSLISKASTVACGSEFTMWICEGKLFSAGCPQYGQLGHGSDHQYNAADSSVKMVFDPQPTPKSIATLAAKEVTRVACGQNHAICVCSDGGVWTWGFGGYGRLGHKVQQDEFKPKLVEALTGRITVPADAVIAAGSTSSFCTITGGMLYCWGKLKVSGDNQMYPIAYDGLMGWDIKSLSCGATTFGCSASAGGEQSVITWGQAMYGELGYGEGGKKSSAMPDKCMALEGVKCYQVAMGQAHSLFLVDSEDEKVKNAPVYDAKEIDDTAPIAAAAADAKGGKRKAPAAKGGAKKGKK